MSRLKLVAILCLVTLIAYLSSFSNPFIWDDEQFIQKNIYVANFDIPKIFTTNTVAGAGVKSNYYRPFTSISFAIDKAIWGLNPFPFHFVNTTVHIVAGILIFLLLMELGFGTLVAFFVSLIFLVHPIQTEAVTYINSRGDSLYTAFLMASLYFFAKSFKEKKLYLMLSVILFVSAILSKETAMAGLLLFGLILLTNFFTFHINVKKFIATHTVQIFAFLINVLVVIGYLLLRFTVLNFENTLNFYNQQNMYSENIFVRLFTFCKIIWIYLGLLVFPYPLHMERSVSYVTSFFSVEVISLILLLLFLFGLGVFAYRKKKQVTILFGLLWFLVMLIPVSGIIPINGLLYEHWLYLPMVGFFIFIIGISKFTLPVNKTLIRKLGIALGIILVTMYGILTIRQNNIWSDPITFYQYTLLFNKTARVENNLAMAYDDKGDIDKAIKYYSDSLTLEDTYQAHYNLGNALFQKGQYALAEEQLVKAYQLAPTSLFIYPSLLNAYVANKHFKEALPIAQKLSMTPYDKDVIFNVLYGEILFEIGKKDEAETKFTNAIRLSGNNEQIINKIKQIRQE